MKKAKKTKKAKKMFKKLKYRNVDKGEKEYTWFRYRNDDTEVTFSPYYGKYSVMDRDDGSAKDVSVELHQAITQQMKELGWIK